MSQRKPKRVWPAQVDAFEAKTNLGQLLDQVEGGDTIVITRHGRAVARLVPCTAHEGTDKVGRAIERMFALQKTMSLGGLSIEEMLHEGHEL